ncbi:MAG: competence protein ComEC, partial [Rhodococcus sp. (in: high G+C Gram-positive bacteria)]
AAVFAPWAGWLASLVLELASAPLWWLVAVARWSASLPGAGVVMPSGVAGALTVSVVTAVMLLLLRLRVYRWVLGGTVVAVLVMWVASSIL